MGVYQVHTDDGSVYEVHTEDSMATKASQFLQNPSNALPLSPVPLVKGTLQAANAGKEADKNYPAENVLPAVGGTIGALATAPIPGASILGAGVGGMGGEYARQIVSGLRVNGNNLPQDTGQSTTMALNQGKNMAGAEAIGLGAGKIGEAIGAGNMAKTGFGKLKSYIEDVFAPSKSVTPDAIKAMRDQYATTPVAKNVGDVANEIKGILEDKGINVEPPQSQDYKNFIKNITDPAIRSRPDGSTYEIPGVSEDVAKKLAENNPDLQSQMLGIAKSAIPKTTDLGLPANELQPLVKVQQALQNPDLTYKDLSRLKDYVDSQSNFIKNDANRDGIDKLYGSVYNKLNELQSNTAKEGGFLDNHLLMKAEGQKYFARNYLKDMFQKSRDFGTPGEPEDYGKVAQALGQFTDSQLQRKFGLNAPQIETLRGISGNYQKTFGGTPVVASLGQSGVPMVRVRGNFLRRFNVPSNVDQILANKLQLPENSELGQQIFNRLPLVKGTIKAGIKGSVPLVTNENR